jgi:hypothetical protein
MRQARGDEARDALVLLVDELQYVEEDRLAALITAAGEDWRE